MMKTVVIATQNQDKLKELASLMRGTGVRVRSLSEFGPVRGVRENGRTFEANARKKARAYSRATGMLTLADDSGLTVERLNGRPGVYSARFAGPGCSYADNNRKLLRLLEGVRASGRRARFVCVAAVYDNGRFVGVARGECRGRIAERPRGRNGFGYDPVFIPRGMTRTFAQLSRRTKNRVSHRSRALAGAKRIILSRFSRT